MRTSFIFVILTFSLIHVLAQNTVGTLTYNRIETVEGYNLIYPHNQPNVYLLNNCGEVVHVWEDDSEFRPGNTAYLMANGNLVKTKRGSSPINDPIWAGGGGEYIEVRNWKNELIASFQLNNDTARLHHDIAITNEGNILMVAWELKTRDEALKAGRNPDLLANDVLWSEMILEWDFTSDEIVWEWHAWDHLIQDYDPLADNFGVVSEHPELIDINYDEHEGHPDWLHINSIDYNPVLDQIALSIPYFNELWIIDHSTSTNDAASHSGGKSNKGGDLIHRWGNPMTYDSGDESDKKLFFQHDVKWVNPEAQADSPDFGLISLYNNRVNERYSSANVIQTLNSDSEYYFENGAFGPNDFHKTVVHPDTAEIAVSTGLSGAQFFPNGNVLIHSGRWGYTYEVTEDNDIVWEYRVPLRAGSPIEQGTELSVNQNITFRVDRYVLDFPAFVDRELIPGKRLELNPNDSVCDVVSSVDDITPLSDVITILGNPIIDQLNFNSEIDDQFDLVDYSGLIRNQINVQKGYNSVDLIEIPSGIYFLRSASGAILKFVVSK